MQNLLTLIHGYYSENPTYPVQFSLEYQLNTGQCDHGGNNPLGCMVYIRDSLNRTGAVQLGT